MKKSSTVDPSTNPNLFRLSLPEWLKDQVSSGVHKGVNWIDEEKKIFQVPWKHASRNGWDYEDVSLFRAWAIYTKRFREGIDTAKPALWKTNFRCAVNSHNCIVFLHEQGERKGDKAHRIMQILETPKKAEKRSENSRKFVRITLPSYPDPAENETQQVSNNSTNYLPKPVNCKNCNEVKLQVQDIFEKILEGYLDKESRESLKSKYLAIVSLKQHICIRDNLESLLDEKTEEIPQVESLGKPNLNDLYNVGKALQSRSDNESQDIRTEIITEEVIETAAESFINENGDVYIAIQNVDSENEVKLVLIDKNQIYKLEKDVQTTDECELSVPDVSRNETTESVTGNNVKVISAKTGLPDGASELYFAAKHKDEEDELIKPRD